MYNIPIQRAPRRLRASSVRPSVCPSVQLYCSLLLFSADIYASNFKLSSTITDITVGLQ